MPSLRRAISACLEKLHDRLHSILKPPPRLNCCQWADRFRYLSPEASSQPGKYRSSHAPYQREPMESVTDESVTATVLMWASQLGKTELVNNIIGFFIDADPSPILMVVPTIDLAESWSKERLVPMLRDTPALANKVKEARSRDSGNTVLHKSFPGGNIAIAGANAPSGLAGRPRRVVLEDEIDRYPASAGT
ncbi:MAG: phage terminase large subunit family protein, partial [Verrucomicrobiota bacterium]